MILAIDPDHCGCTDCVMGESVPLHIATEVHFALYLGGLVVNRTHFTDDELRARARQEVN